MTRRIRFVIGAVLAALTVLAWTAGASAHQPSLTLTCGHVRAEMFLYPLDAVGGLVVDGQVRHLASNGVYEADLNPLVNHTATFTIVPGSDGQGAYSRSLAVTNCAPTTTTVAPTTSTTVAQTTTTESTVPPSSSTVSPSTTTTPSESSVSTSPAPTTPPTSSGPTSSSAPSSSAASVPPSTPNSVPQCQTSSTSSDGTTTASNSCGTSSTPPSTAEPTPSPPTSSPGTSWTPSQSVTVCRMVGGVPTQVTRWEAWTQQLDHLCPLPSTGRDDSWFIAIGILACVIGAILVAASRRPS